MRRTVLCHQVKRFWIVLFLSAVSVSFAQQSDAPSGPIVITKIEDSLVQTPNYQVTSPNIMVAPPISPTPKWLQVNFDFTSNSERQVIDAVQFRVYIEVSDLAYATDKDGPPALLTGETTFINLPNERDLHGSFFVHPYTLRRYGGEQAFNFKGKKNIRIEALIDGQQVSFKDEHEDDPNWIASLKKIGGMVLSRDMSPWALMNIDHYPPVKPRTLSQ